jgi:hypothetical protein
MTVALFVVGACHFVLLCPRPALAQSGVVVAETVSSGTFTSEKGGLRMAWNITLQQGETARPARNFDRARGTNVGTRGTTMKLELEFTLDSQAYIALGFGLGMLNSDMIIGWVGTDGLAHARDAWSRGHEAPVDDVALGGSDDVHVVGGSVIGTATTLRVTRLLDTNDTYDAVIPASGPVSIIYAWGRDGTARGNVSFHGDNHNMAQIDFSRADGVPLTPVGEEEEGVGARHLVAQTTVGTLSTIQTETAGGVNSGGFPFGSVASFADEVPSTGQPLILLSTLERNVINLEAEARCSLSVHALPAQNCTPSAAYEPMATARTTLLGYLVPVGSAALPAARKAYLAQHPQASEWIGFDDFTLYRMNVTDVYWVGGFGGQHYIGWVAASTYLSQPPGSA